MPQADAGIRTEPPVSVPGARSTSPAASAAADPEDEPPGMRASSCGLRTGGRPGVWPIIPHASWCIASLPTIVAPASRWRRTLVASTVQRSCRNGAPESRSMPATEKQSLNATTRPVERPLRRRRLHLDVPERAEVLVAVDPLQPFVDTVQRARSRLCLDRAPQPARRAPRRDRGGAVARPAHHLVARRRRDPRRGRAPVRAVDGVGRRAHLPARSGRRAIACAGRHGGLRGVGRRLLAGDRRRPDGLDGAQPRARHRRATTPATIRATCWSPSCTTSGSSRPSPTR